MLTPFLGSQVGDKSLNDVLKKINGIIFQDNKKDSSYLESKIPSKL